MRPSLNPFRASAIARLRYRIHKADLLELANTAEKCHFQACIQGPHGSGKSTLLKDLSLVLENSGKKVQWHYINRQMSPSTKSKILKLILNDRSDSIHCLDGGEALGPLSWFIFLLKIKLSRRYLLATTHYTCALSLIYNTNSQIALALDLSRELAGSHWNENLEKMATKSFKENLGNVREVFRSCYFACAKLN